MTLLPCLPDLAPLTSISSEVRIPRARLGVLQLKGWGFFRTYEPALFQERICVMPQRRPFASTISAPLSERLDSGLLHEIDWIIENFAFDDNFQGRRCYMV